MIRLLPILLTSCELKVKNLSTSKKEKYIYGLVERWIKQLDNNYFEFFANEDNFIDLLTLKYINTFEDFDLKEENKIVVKCLDSKLNPRIISKVEFKSYNNEYECEIFFSSKDDDYIVTLDLKNLQDDDLNYLENNKYLLEEIGKVLFKEYIKYFIIYYINLYNIDNYYIDKLNKIYNLEN